MTSQQRLAWISCRDQIPKTRGQGFWPVLFVTKESRAVCAGRYFRTRRRFISLQGVSFAPSEVSHWMEMPEPPNE